MSIAPEKVQQYRNGPEGFFAFVEEWVYLPIYPIGETVRKWVPFSEFPSDYLNMWEEQKKILREALKMENGQFKYRLIILMWPRGEGKCQAKGSKVLMYDGSVKKVEEITVGDLLMGDDNTPRRVLSLVTGWDEMFKVTPNRGEPLVVNDDHVLTLKRNRVRKRFKKHGGLVADNKAKEIIDIPVKEYRDKSNTFKGQYSLYRVPVDWPEKEVPIDPYFLGLWLGDGTSRAEDTHRHILNPLLNSLRDSNLIKNKHVPLAYKANSRKVRLQVLAGLVDSGGYINRNSVQFTLKSRRLCNDILFIARSLGFHAEMKQTAKTIKGLNFSGKYYRVGISGDCSIIPTRVPRKKARPRSNWKDLSVTGIKEIEPVGRREYYGFMLDGNGRYVTEDFTVTHNSILAVLIQLWRFLWFPDMVIILGANSIGQIRFMHFEEMVRIIQHSPKILHHIGPRNIQQKQIQLTDSKDRVVAFIRPVSSFTGLYSGATGYTFSEFHQATTDKFFVEIDSSMRGVRNALGVIDTTVADKDHILYRLYKSFLAQKDPSLFFSYRKTDGRAEQFWNPEITQDYLDSQKERLLFDFDRFFINSWESGSKRLFTPEVVEATKYLGVDRAANQQNTLIELIAQKNRIIDTDKKMLETGMGYKLYDRLDDIEAIDNRLWPMSDIMQLHDQYGTAQCATVEMLSELSDIFDTDWAITAGLDRADPYADRSPARTILSFIAKGLARSRSNPLIMMDGGIPYYIYILLHLVNILSHSLEDVKEITSMVDTEFNGLDMFTAERWGVFDLDEWCQSQKIEFAQVFPTYPRQRTAFTELYLAVKHGRFKAPPLAVWGYKPDSSEDLLREEMNSFDHVKKSETTGEFFSPEKGDKFGVQDDVMFSIGWNIYGGRHLTVDHFRPRRPQRFFGAFFENPTLVGKY